MPTLELATPEFLDTAPFRVEVDVTVLAPVDACWSLLVDQASWVQWFDDMSAVSATPWLWTKPGQRRTVTVNGLKVDEVAISVEPKREYAFAIAKWPLPIATKAAEGVRLEDQTNGGSPRTTLTYIGAFESTAIGKRTEAVLSKQLTDAWGPALKTLGELANQASSNPDGRQQ